MTFAPFARPSGETLRISLTCRAEITVDLPALIYDDLDAYWSVNMRGYQEYERPMVYLYDVWLDQVGDTDTSLPHSRFDVYAMTPDLDDNWSREHYAELIRQLPEAAEPPSDEDLRRQPQPGQLALDDAVTP